MIDERQHGGLQAWTSSRRMCRQPSCFSTEPPRESSLLEKTPQLPSAVENVFCWKMGSIAGTHTCGRSHSYAASVRERFMESRLWTFQRPQSGPNGLEVIECTVLRGQRAWLRIHQVVAIVILKVES